MLLFVEWGKPEYPEKNLSEQGRKPMTNSTHIIMSSTLRASFGGVCVCGGGGGRVRMGDSNHRRALINLAHKKIEREGVVKKT